MTPAAIEDLGELTELPNGLRLYYRDRDHSYWRCNDDLSRGKRYTGVTTVIKPIDFDPERLLKWAAKLNTIGVARRVESALETEYPIDDPETLRASLDWLLSEDPERIWAELERHGLTYEDIREERATLGTNIHEIVLGSLARGEPTPDFSALTSEEEGYAHAVIDFWLDHNPAVLEVEQIVADEELGVAGRYDVTASFGECDDALCPCHGGSGSIGLIDCKTGSFVAEREHCQVALYAHLRERAGLGAVEWTGLLHVGANGRYRLWTGNAALEEALSAVETYRARGRIRNRAGKERKARA